MIGEQNFSCRMDINIIRQKLKWTPGIDRPENVENNHKFFQLVPLDPKVSKKDVYRS